MSIDKTIELRKDIVFYKKKIKSYVRKIEKTEKELKELER